MGWIFANFVFRLAIEVPQSGGRVEVLCPRSQSSFFETAWVSSLFSNQTKVTSTYQQIFEHFIVSSLEKLIFQQSLKRDHSAKRTSTWFKDQGVTVLGWLASLTYIQQRTYKMYILLECNFIKFVLITSHLKLLVKWGLNEADPHLSFFSSLA